MLVLTRKAGQRIQIGDSCFLTVTSIKGNRVALGIEAPNEVAICRGELIPIETPQEHESIDHSNESKQVA